MNAVWAWILMAAVWQLILPTDPTEFWTMVLGISTIALTVTAAIGLRSLVLTKREMLTRAQRDARESAIARFQELARDIIPANARLWAAMAASKVNPIFIPNPGSVQFGP